MTRSRGWRAVLSLLVPLLVVPPSTHAGGLTFLESQPFEHTMGSVQGLDGALAVAVDPDDDARVYVAGTDAVSLWQRDIATGRLTFQQALFDGVDADMIRGANAIAVAPATSGDSHVYVTGRADDAIALFTSDQLTGMLTFVGFVRDGHGIGHPPANSVKGPTGLAVSPDGGHVYVTAGQSQTVVVFSRDPMTGFLSYLASYESTNDVPPFEGLNHPRGITTDPDGEFVYVAAHRATPGGEVRGTVVVFRRDDDPMSLTFGALTYESLVQDGMGTPPVQHLNDPQSLVVSEDGSHVYVASFTGNALVAFTRDDDPMSMSFGDLTFLEAHIDGGIITGLGNAWGVGIDPGGEYVYVTGRNERSVNVFARDAGAMSPNFGKLEFVESLVSLENKKSPKFPYRCNGGTNDQQVCSTSSECPAGTCSGDAFHGLTGPAIPVLTADGKHLYVTGQFPGSIVAFATDECGNGTRGTDEECDDASSFCVACRLVVCGAAPLTGCGTVHSTTPADSSVTIKNDATKSDGKDGLQWQWKKGNVADPAFGNPVTTADYVICVYDSSGNPQPLASRAAPRGKGWTRKVDGSGNLKEYKYKNTALRPDGLEQIKLKVGAGTKAQVTFKGKGFFLKPPFLAPFVPGPAGLVTPVTVEVRNTENDDCWTATYDDTVVPKRIQRNDAAQFKAKSN